MKPLRLGLIGHGAIGQAIVACLRAEGRADELVALLKRTPAPGDAQLPVHYTLDSFLDARPTVVIEAAGHEATLQHGPAVLDAGARLVVSSVGVFADDAQRLRFSRGDTLIPAGAVAGLDGLAAARLAGLDSVTYTSSKPPRAWLGTPAQKLVNLEHAEEELVFFDGSAREAARLYPRNANVAATVALAGIGFERTRVRLVSSRRVDDPLGVIDASGAFGRFHFSILAHAFADNPKSSMLTAYSLIQSARLGLGLPLQPSDAMRLPNGALPARSIGV